MNFNSGIRLSDITPENQNEIYDELKRVGQLHSQKIATFDIDKSLKSDSVELSMIYSQCSDSDLLEVLNEKTPLSSVTKTLRDRSELPVDSKLPRVSFGLDVLHDMKIIEAAAQVNPNGRITVGFSFGANTLDFRREIEFKSINKSGSLMKAYHDELETKTDRYFNELCKSQCSPLKNGSGEMIFPDNAFKALYTRISLIEKMDNKFNNYIKDNNMEKALEETKNKAVDVLYEKRLCKALGIER